MTSLIFKINCKDWKAGLTIQQLNKLITKSKMSTSQMNVIISYLIWIFKTTILLLLSYALKFRGSKKKLNLPNSLEKNIILSRTAILKTTRKKKSGMKTYINKKQPASIGKLTTMTQL